MGSRCRVQLRWIHSAPVAIELGRPACHQYGGDGQRAGRSLRTPAGVSRREPEHDVLAGEKTTDNSVHGSLISQSERVRRRPGERQGATVQACDCAGSACVTGELLKFSAQRREVHVGERAKLADQCEAAVD